MRINTLTPAARVRTDECVRVVAPYAGLAALQAQSAPMTAMHGISVSAAGFNGTDVTAVPGSPPREAPV